MSYSQIGMVSTEGTLEKWPSVLLDKRRRGSGIEISLTRISEVGDVYEGEGWRCLTPSQHGTTGPLDGDVYVAILALSELHGVPDGAEIGAKETALLPFSVYGICELLRIGHRGNRYESVRESISRWAHTTCTPSVEAWKKVGDTGAITSTSFSPFGRRFADSLLGGRHFESHRLYFNEPFLSSLRSGISPPLDFDFYLESQGALGRRFYRYLNHVCDEGGEFEIPVAELRQMLPLAASQGPREIRRKLAPVHASLIDRGFLDQVVQEGRGPLSRLIYRRRPGFAEGRRLLRLRNVVRGMEGGEPAVKALLALNNGLPSDKRLKSGKAERLVRDYGPERCMHCAAHTEPIKYRLKRPIGYLITALESGRDFGQLPESSEVVGPKDTSPNDRPKDTGGAVVEDAGISVDLSSNVPDLGKDSSQDPDSGSINEGFARDLNDDLNNDLNNDFDENVDDEVNRRRRAGEFDPMIEAVLAASSDELVRYFGRDLKDPRDTSDLRYHLSDDGELFVYVGISAEHPTKRDPEDRCSLGRPRETQQRTEA